MASELTFTVDVEHNKIRLDKFSYLVCDGISRTRIQDLITNGHILVNERIEDKNYKVKLNDIVKILLPDAVMLENTNPENIPIDIIYEDKDVLVVNKEKGMVVHPAPGNWSGTLVNALLYHCKGKLSDINGVIRPGIVHRIDKNTSGLLIVAKSNEAHQHLAKQIQAHTFSREYEALVHGIIRNENGEINLPIGRDHKNRQKFSVTFKNSKQAITLYKVLQLYEKFSHIRLTLKTGRTHQIRVHMAHLNHPVAGDTTYGIKNMTKNEQNLHGQCLHSKYIKFMHPIKNIFLEFETNLPKYFTDFLLKLQNKL